MFFPHNLQVSNLSTVAIGELPTNIPQPDLGPGFVLDPVGQSAISCACSGVATLPVPMAQTGS